MGYLHYGDQKFQFEDRVLTHLRTVIAGKLVLQECFMFTWRREEQQHSIWFHPTNMLHFEFDAAVTQPINRKWVEALAALANSPAGLKLIAEPQ